MKCKSAVSKNKNTIEYSPIKQNQLKTKNIKNEKHDNKLNMQTSTKVKKNEYIEKILGENIQESNL